MNYIAKEWLHLLKVQLFIINIFCSTDPLVYASGLVILSPRYHGNPVILMRLADVGSDY